MQIKEYSMTLDMKRTLPFRPFEVVEGDTGNVLHITLQNDGETMDLSGCGLCIVFASSSGFAIQDLTSGVSRGEETGEIDVQLNPTAYGAGNVSVDVQVYSGEDNALLITSTRFDFRCRRSLISEDILRASTAYPPLIAAAATANEAAAAALAAAARIDTDIGEMNVQADWDETDTASNAFIANKPTSFLPTAHAAAHAAVGADAITPSSIGAMTADAPPNAHAASHAPNGTDAITGYELARLQFTDTAVATTAFVADTTYTDFPYRAAIAMTGVIAAMTPEIVFSATDALSGTFAPVAACYAGGVYIYASEVPSSAITIPTIICWKAVG